jgi:hypothetical protein
MIDLPPGFVLEPLPGGGTFASDRWLPAPAGGANSPAVAPSRPTAGCRRPLAVRARSPTPS